jgi:hypothetical protein
MKFILPALVTLLVLGVVAAFSPNWQMWDGTTAASSPGVFMY